MGVPPELPRRATAPLATAGAALESLYAFLAGKFYKPIHHVDTVLFEYRQERQKTPFNGGRG